MKPQQKVDKTFCVPIYCKNEDDVDRIYNFKSLESVLEHYKHVNNNETKSTVLMAEEQKETFLSFAYFINFVFELWSLNSVFLFQFLIPRCLRYWCL